MRITDVILSIVAGLLGYPFFMLFTFGTDFLLGEKSFFWQLRFDSKGILFRELSNDWLSTLPIFMIISVLMMLIFSFFRDNKRFAYWGIWGLNTLVMVYLYFMGLSFFVLLFSFFTLLFFTYANSLFKNAL